MFAFRSSCPRILLSKEGMALQSWHESRDSSGWLKQQPRDVQYISSTEFYGDKNKMIQTNGTIERALIRHVFKQKYKRVQYIKHLIVLVEPLY